MVIKTLRAFVTDIFVCNIIYWLFFEQNTNGKKYEIPAPMLQSTELLYFLFMTERTVPEQCLSVGISEGSPFRLRLGQNTSLSQVPSSEKVLHLSTELLLENQSFVTAFLSDSPSSSITDAFRGQFLELVVAKYTCDGNLHLTEGR